MSRRTDRGEKRGDYLPTPLARFKLNVFGQLVYDLIGSYPYLVGSATQRSDWRDVDVRIMVDDERFDAVFGGDGLWVTNNVLKLFNMGLSALASDMTGLPVDAQIQRASDANSEYGGHERHALIGPARDARDPDLIPSPLDGRD